MKKTAFALTLVLVIMAAPLLVNFADANMIWLLWYPVAPDRTPPFITIYSPSANETFASTNDSTSILLNFTVSKPRTWFSNTSYSEGYMPGTYYSVVRMVSYNYTLDGDESQSVPLNDTFHLTGSPNETLNLSSNLAVPTGAHNLTINFECQSVYVPFEGYAAGFLSISFYGQSPVVNFFVTALPLLSMPVEYVNYTIAPIDGALWAKIDGTYPIQILNINSAYFPLGSLPMVYPTPPGTTNINLTLNEKPIDWINYTQLYPTALHHTAIGEWPMIYCTIKPITANFTLKIHYEHPLPMVNGSYLFLYDLNIASYLSPQSPTSTAYFKIRTNQSISDLKAYTTETDAVWNPIDCTTSQEGTMQVFSVQIQSEYSKPLKGDLVITLNGEGNPDFPSWATPILFAATTVGICLSLLVYWKKRKRQTH